MAHCGKATWRQLVPDHGLVESPAAPEHCPGNCRGVTELTPSQLRAQHGRKERLLARSPLLLPGAHLANGRSMSDRGGPLATADNGTLLARSAFAHVARYEAAA